MKTEIVRAVFLFNDLVIKSKICENIKSDMLRKKNMNLFDASVSFETMRINVPKVPHGKILYQNPVYLKLFGFYLKELMKINYYIGKILVHYKNFQM